MRYQDQAWKKSTLLEKKFKALKYAFVERPSNSRPGVPYNTPVKILAVTLTNSTYYVGMPYLLVQVELPNGEQRHVSGLALCVGKDAAKKFRRHKNAFVSPKD